MKSTIAEPFRQLAGSRLWPLAVLLLIAAVAAPLLLADREELPPVPSAQTGTPVDALQAALVTPAGTETTGARRVLGARKDPFTPTGPVPPKPKPTTAPPSAPPAGPSNGTPSTGPGSGSGGGTGGAPSDAGPGLTPAPSSSAPAPLPIPAPAPAPGKPKRESFALYSLKVRVDDTPRVLKRLDPLPSPESPAVIYLGLLEGGRTAVFLVDSGVKAEGDGDCHPSPQDCQRVYLREGDTEFFTLEGEDSGELQLDLIDIHAKRTKSAGAARAAYATASQRGRRALRSRIARVGRLRYDQRKGTLRLLSRQGWKASVARAAAGR